VPGAEEASSTVRGAAEAVAIVGAGRSRGAASGLAQLATATASATAPVARASARQSVGARAITVKSYQPRGAPTR